MALCVETIQEGRGRPQTAITPGPEMCDWRYHLSVDGTLNPLGQAL